MGFTPPNSGSAIAIKDEGVTLTAAATSLDFTGAGVTASAVGTSATANVPAGGGGSVTDVSVVSANGLAGSVATSTTTPAITLSTTVTGVLSGNGTAISAASTTGSGAVVLATSPSLTAPVLGIASATSINKVAITAPASSATLTIADGKVLTASNTLTFTGTDSSSVAFGAGGTVLYNGGALGTPSSGTATNLTGTATGLTAGAVTGATFTTALTVNTGTVTLTGNVANTSVLTVGAGAVSVSGTNTGDQTTVSGNAGTATALQNARSIYGNSFNGTADLTQVIASTYGGTGNGFTKFSGPDTTEKTFTLPNANATLARTDAGQTFTGVNVFTSPKIITDVSDTNGNELLKLTATGSAVNEVTIANAATGNDPVWTSSGGDSNVGLKLAPKGTGTIYGNQETIVVAISDETTDITTGLAKVTFHMPYAFNLVKVKAGVTAASSSGNPAFDLNDDGVSVFSTTVTIDANETFSDDAGTPSALTSTPLAIAAKSVMTIDVDTAGTGTKGAKLYLIGYPTAKP